MLPETTSVQASPAPGTPSGRAELESKFSTYLLDTYKRTPFHPRSGKGARLVDADGKVYWDLLAGIAVNGLGYAHPKLVKALREESRNLYHVSNLFYHPYQAALAERVVLGSGLSKVFLCNSGTEATEAALKFSRLANPGRTKLVSLEESFHGRTFGALSLTGHAPYRTPFEPLLPGVTFVPPNDEAALTAAVTDDTAAVFLEPILGEAGVIPLTTAFLAKARELCDRTGAVLVLDEIQCGLGRTGRLFAFQQSGVLPDMVTLAKPLGGGLPLGAVVVNERIAALVRPGHHGTTFGGNPLACRLGVETLDVIQAPGFLERVTSLGTWFGKELRRLQKRTPAVVAVRGQGLMWGIELDREVKEVVPKLLARGFVVGTARQKVLRLLPPLIVPRQALAAFITTLEEILKETA